MKKIARSPWLLFASACCCSLLLSASPVPAVSVSADDDLVFIHHSCGYNWLADSLNAALAAKSYIDERNDIYYGTDVASDSGRPDSLGATPGDNTNMNHWIRWFNDYLGAVKAQGCATGVNRIVMFKSCFPTSSVTADGTDSAGDPFSATQSLANYKAVYRHPSGVGHTYSNSGYQYKALEEIFAENPDTLFIAVTAPPLYFDSTSDADAHRARVFNNWLKNDWLTSYNSAHSGLNNVAVYDWFDFLANADAATVRPNRLKDSYVASAGDSHPNGTANSASTVDFCTGPGNFIDKAWNVFIGTTTARITARSPHTVTLAFGTARSRTYRIEVSTNQAGWLIRGDGLTSSPCVIDRLYPSSTYYFRITERSGDVVTGTTTISGVTDALPSTVIPPAGGSETAIDTVNGAALETKVTLGAGTLSRDVYIRIMTDPVAAPDRVDPAGITAANRKLSVSRGLLEDSATEVTMYDLAGSTVSEAFHAPVTLTIPYPDADQDSLVDGTSVREETLAAYLLDETNGKWEPVTDALDTVANTVTIPLTHFSVYALAGAKAPAATLKQVIVYPNPFKPSATGGSITFQNLSANARIAVYTIAGQLVYEHEKRDTASGFTWDAVNSAGNRLASGIYLYVITNLDNTGDTAKGKIAVIR